MANKRSIRDFFRNINRKQRLSLRTEHDDSEMWYMHISPLEFIGGLLALLLILFIVILTLVAYTPIMNLIPGYSGNKMREQMIENIIKVDSMEVRLGELQAYYSNVSMILDGKTPVTRNVAQVGDSVRSVKPEAIAPSAADSALRRQMELPGLYSLSTTVAPQGSLQTGNLILPVKGVVTTHFNPKEGRFGVGIATASNQQILAVAEGTVILSTWSPDQGHIIQIQHGGQLVSTYRRSTQSLRTVGERVQAGEVIGNTGEGISGEQGKGLFEFELWLNGTPVDPESFMVF